MEIDDIQNGININELKINGIPINHININHIFNSYKTPLDCANELKDDIPEKEPIIKFLLDRKAKTYKDIVETYLNTYYADEPESHEKIRNLFLSSPLMLEELNLIEQLDSN